jgi:hypothetical protein
LHRNRECSVTRSALSAESAEFSVLSAHALAAQGHPRATGDLDIWVRPTSENAARVWRALARFGAPHGVAGQAAARPSHYGTKFSGNALLAARIAPVPL